MSVYALSTYSLKHIRSSIVLLFVLEKKTTQELILNLVRTSAMHFQYCT